MVKKEIDFIDNVLKMNIKYICFIIFEKNYIYLSQKLCFFIFDDIFYNIIVAVYKIFIAWLEKELKVS